MTEPTKRRRARKADGKFRADDPTTAVNEAWESTPVEEALPKKDGKYAVKQKVKTTSNTSAGKYSKKEKVRPTFGKVTTTYH